LFLEKLCPYIRLRNLLPLHLSLSFGARAVSINFVCK
jgi:hypothetical protein